MSKIEKSDFFDSFATSRRHQSAATRTNALSRHDFRQALVDETGGHLAHDPGSDSRPKDQSMTQIMAHIHHISQELRQKITWSAITEYREAVIQMLSLARSELFYVEQITSRNTKGQSTRFVLIKEIDTKMHALVSHFIQREHSQLRILEAVGEINGLLIDLQS